MGNGKYIAYGVIITIAIIAIIGAGLYYAGKINPAGLTTTSTTIPATITQHLKVNITEYKFTPENFTFNSTEDVSFEVINKGNQTHNFYIQGIGGTADIPPNGIEYLNITKNTVIPDVYTCFSTISGDRDLGLTCNVTVK